MYAAISLALCAIILLGIFCISSDAEELSCSTNRPALPPPCDSQIYCQGKILHAIQMSRMFNDSKTFVDMKLKHPENVIIEKYEQKLSELGTALTKEDLVQFVNENFEQGDELEQWTPPDYTEEPSLANRVSKPEYKNWVLGLNKIFLELSRKVKIDVKDNPESYSMEHVPYGFCMAGGRFTEQYYWDSHWILKGLLLLDMPQTARGIIENFLYLIRKYGFVLNGNRKYYTLRSQPPLLIPMAYMYNEATKDMDFLRQNIDEFDYWMKNHAVKIEKGGTEYTLFRYYAPSSGPRPESYREDYTTAENVQDEADKETLYTNLKTAAESGMDFSTRWMIKDGTNQGDLSDIKASEIVPVDLNAFLHQNAQMLEQLYTFMGDSKEADNFKRKADTLLRAIDAVLWNEARGIWLDHDMKNNKPRDYFYLSNLTPIWTGSYLQTKEFVSKSVLAYLKEFKADQFIGGLPCSMYSSGQQWDFPNAWPPQQSIVIQGLERLGTPEAKEEARRLADIWLQTNYEGYLRYNTMFEKYNATLFGETGAGGEYTVQKGFGWSNGVDLEMINEYYTLTSPGC